MNISKSPYLFAMFVIFLLGLVSFSAVAAPTGKVIIASGDCKINGKPASRGSTINNGDTITTGKDGHLQYRSVDNGLTQVDPNSTLTVTLTAAATGNGAQNNLTQGALLTLSGKVKAPATAGSTKLAIHGTLFSLRAGKVANEEAVWKGEAEVTNRRGEHLDIGPHEKNQIALCNEIDQLMVGMSIEPPNIEGIINSQNELDSSPEVSQEATHQENRETVENSILDPIDEEEADSIGEQEDQELNEEIQEEELDINHESDEPIDLPDNG
jgi:FecR protein/Baseplate J-like protein